RTDEAEIQLPSQMPRLLQIGKGVPRRKLPRPELVEDNYSDIHRLPSAGRTRLRRQLSGDRFGLEDLHSMFADLDEQVVNNVWEEHQQDLSICVEVLTAMLPQQQLADAGVEQVFEGTSNPMAWPALSTR